MWHIPLNHGLSFLGTVEVLGIVVFAICISVFWNVSIVCIVSSVSNMSHCSLKIVQLALENFQCSGCDIVSGRFEEWSIGKWSDPDRLSKTDQEKCVDSGGSQIERSK